MARSSPGRSPVSEYGYPICSSRGGPRVGALGHESQIDSRMPSRMPGLVGIHARAVEASSGAGAWATAMRRQEGMGVISSPQ